MKQVDGEVMNVELRVIDTGMRCPRCGQSWLLETVLDGRVISLTCMNPDKDACGGLFVAEGEAPHVNKGAGRAWYVCVRDQGHYAVALLPNSVNLENQERRH